MPGLMDALPDLPANLLEEGGGKPGVLAYLCPPRTANPPFPLVSPSLPTKATAGRILRTKVLQWAEVLIAGLEHGR